jgi:Fe-S cluster assembly protein SufD
MADVTTDTQKAGYLAELNGLTAAQGPEWLEAIRTSGAQRFADLSLPDSKTEEWRFTNIAPIRSSVFKSVASPVAHGLEKSQIAPYSFEGMGMVAVFVDGFFAPELSSLESIPEGVKVGGIAQSTATNGVALEPHLDQYASTVGNAYSALNSAFLQDGAVVRVAKNVVVDDPIHLIFLSTGHHEATARYPRILVVMEACSEATVIESHVTNASTGAYFSNAVGEYSLDPSANLRMYKIVEEGADAFHLATQRVRQDRDSRFTSYVFNLEGRIVRNELSINLDGEGAECSLHGLYLTEGDQLIDNYQSIIHGKANCSSWIGYKGVLDDASKAVYTGKILVERDSQQTDSNQLNQNVLLSDKAQIDTKPQLEIYADDVKCTHGATIGQFPDELIHYFRTRGIDGEMAKAMLTYGFADEVVREVEVPSLQKHLEAYVFDKYSPK